MTTSRRFTTRMALACLSLGLAASGARAAATVGQPAPAFSLPGSDGKTHALADYSGKIVVLEWFNRECPFVKKHYDSQNMQKLQRNYTAKDVVWLSVISSAPGKQGHATASEAATTAKELNATPTVVLLDESGSVGQSYGAKTTPHMFLIDPDGKLLYMGGIDSIASPDADDIPKATQYVKVAFGEASAGKPVSNPSTRPYGCSVKY